MKHLSPDDISHEIVDIDTLKPHPNNPNNGDTDLIGESIGVHGVFRSVVVSSDGFLLAGNHTWMSAMEKGETRLHIDRLPFKHDTPQAKAIMAVDNRAARVAKMDDGLLADLLQSLPSLEGTGYTDKLLEDLMRNNGGGGTPGEDNAPEKPEDPATQPGDLWLLGPHRLLCGDATTDLPLLTADTEINVILTDPPYGIDLDTDWRNPTGRVHGRKYKPVQGDDHAFDPTPVLLAYAHVPEQFWFGADYYRRALSTSDRDGSWLVWDKRTEATDTVVGSAFELIWSKAQHKRDLLRHLWTNFNSHHDHGTKRAHPNQKPVALLAEIINRWIAEGAVILDPYAGSGSTLIAAHQTGRIAYMCEIDPSYVQVVIERWIHLTGDDPVRDDGIAWSTLKSGALRTRSAASANA